MVEITLIALGKLKEKFYLAACQEYAKRLGAYCRFRLVELAEIRLSENPSQGEIDQALAKEAMAVEQQIPKGAWFCILTPEGKLQSSEQLSQQLEQVKLMGKSSICFCMGSSFGLDAGLKQRADFRLSMSPMTFPHHLARVMVLEQIYRAQAIAAGSKYHK